MQYICNLWSICSNLYVTAIHKRYIRSMEPVCDTDATGRLYVRVAHTLTSVACLPVLFTAFNPVPQRVPGLPVPSKKSTTRISGFA